MEYVLEIFELRFVTMTTAIRYVVPMTCVTTTKPSQQQQQQPESFLLGGKTKIKVKTGKTNIKLITSYEIL